MPPWNEPTLASVTTSKCLVKEQRRPRWLAARLQSPVSLQRTCDFALPCPDPLRYGSIAALPPTAPARVQKPSRLRPRSALHRRLAGVHASAALAFHLHSQAKWG
eukprot:1648568-Prorocentrum_lima.AAC.1